MNKRHPVMAATRRARGAVAASLVGLAALTVAIGVSDSSAVSGDAQPRAAIPSPGTIGDAGPPPLQGQQTTLAQPPLVRDHVGPRDRGGRLGDAVTAFDETNAAVSRLDPALLAALRRAAADASSQGIELQVNSGWRSAEYQAELLREAVDDYGSAEEAARWVATPETSAHVSGDAVDIGPSKAAKWLSRYGARYGLCQIYENEPWHYELRTAAIAEGCPDMYPDPTHDPRMQQ